MNPRPYPSDLTSQQWAVLKPLLPPARTGGRPRKTEMRSVVNAIFYRNRNGCIWRALPHDFPPWRTVVCTNVSANVAEILSTVADRFSLETTFPDCKEIVRAGQQQARFVWANIGAFNVLPVDLHADQGLDPVPRGGRAGGSLRIPRDS